MPWPTKLRTTPKPLASACSWMARPISLNGWPGPHHGDGPVEALAGDLDQPPALLVDVADEEGGVGVAVDAVEVDRDVEVADVAVDERPVVGDAVADDLVHRRAQRLREAVVVERARVAAPVDAGLVADGVELVGGDARAHGGAGEGQHLGGGPAGDAACAR